MAKVQTLLAKHLRSAIQTMFDRFATSQTLLGKQSLLGNVCKISKRLYACQKQKMFDEQYFVIWPNVQTLLVKHVQFDLQAMFDR